MQVRTANGTLTERSKGLPGVDPRLMSVSPRNRESVGPNLLSPNHFILSRLIRRRFGFVRLQEHSFALATCARALVTERMKGYQASMAVIPSDSKAFNAGGFVDVKFYLFRYHV